jgi:WD40 repeat protein
VQLVPDWQRGSRTERQRELAMLTRQTEAAAGRSGTAPGGLRDDLARFVASVPGTSEALDAARLMTRLTWPLDQLSREAIPPYELRTAGFGLAAQAPRELVAVLGDSRLRQWNRIDSVAVSHDGGWIVSGSDDGTVRVFQPGTGEGTAVIPVGGRPIVVCCSPTHPQVAIGAEQGRVLLWNLRAETVEAELTAARLPISFSPDGNWLATGTQSRGVALWNAQTGLRIREWPLPPRFTLEELVLDPAGQRLVALSREHATILWETGTGEEIRRISRTDHPLFSPDGNWLAAGTPGGTVTLWQTASGEVVRVLDDAGIPLGFRPDGSWLVTTRHGRAIVWDLDTGNELRTILDIGGVATLSPNARFLASGDEHFGGLRFVDLSTGAIRHADGHPEAVTCLAFTPDSATVVTGGADNALKLWEPQSGLERLVAGVGLGPADFSPDGETLAIATDAGSIQLWDVDTRRFSRTLNTEGKRIQSLQFSPNGKLLAAVGDWGFFKITLRLWDAGSGRELTLVDEQPANLRGFAFSPDSRWMATAGSGRTVSLWNLATLRIQRQLEDHPDRVGALAFTPDSRHLAVACQNRTIRFWTLPTGTATLWQSAVPDDIRSLRFSPDGSILSASSVHQRIDLWTVETARQQPPLLAPGRGIRAQSFSPDGRKFAVANSSGQVHFWNWPVTGLGTAPPDRTLKLGPVGGRIRDLRFSPDGRHLLTANGNGTIYILRLSDAE